MKVHEQALVSAVAAANAIADTSFGVFGAVKDDPAPGALGAENVADSFRLPVEFMLENPAVPVDAYWIRSGALGLHPFERRFDELPAPVQLAYKVFRDVLVTVNTAMAEAEAHEIAKNEAAEIESKRRAALEAKGPDPDSPFASIAGPLGPSDLALSLASDKKAREALPVIDVPGAEAESQPEQGQPDPAPAKPKRK